MCSARTDLLNLTSITDAYTPANRLQPATGPWGSLAWTYDGVGNRLTEVAGATRTYAYPTTSNKLTSVTEGVTLLHNNTYDNAGNLITDVRSGVTTAYTYNKRNRLATVTVGGNLKGTYTRVSICLPPAGRARAARARSGEVVTGSPPERVPSKS